MEGSCGRRGEQRLVSIRIHCRELLVDDHCPQWSYHLENTVARQRKQLVTAYNQACQKVTGSWPDRRGSYLGIRLILGILYFLFGGALAVLGALRKFYAHKDLRMRLADHWWVWGWLFKLSVLAVIPWLILSLLNRIINWETFDRMKQSSGDLPSLPPAPVHLYTTPLSLQSLGPPGTE